MAENADYVVIGAGSAGCVIASRLSEDPKVKVVLLEAGPRDWHPMIHIPAGIRSLLENPRVNWNYSSEPEEGSGGRRIHWPRGRVLGGSSSINGMLYVRGNPADYDGWAQRGCKDWGYEQVLPYFMKSEDFRGADADDEYRSRGGPLVVEDYRTVLPITDRFVQAAQQAGYPLTKDYNGAEQEGVAYSQMTRDHRFRASTAQTFLAQAKGRPNLEVKTEAQTGQLLFEGTKCVGVSYRRGGRYQEVRAAREVIVSAGAVNSPHILQISGIGPAAHLQSIGVDVLHDAPGVGHNLSDHYVVRISHRIRDHITINELARGPRLVREIFKYAVKGTGALTMGVTAAMVFCRSREGLSSPDLQLLYTPTSYTGRVIGDLEKKPGISVAVCPVRPESRGTIMAESADPMARPVIRPNYLSAESDSHVLFSGIQQTNKILSSPAIAEVSLGETEPGREIATVEDAKQFAQNSGATIYHPVGTCKMGEDAMSVVDSRLKVKGVEGLRVADASVMPTVTTGNTNAPTIMIGEKAADMIKQDWAA